MASTAIEAELTVVNVVGAMAIIAAATQSHLDVERLPMTGSAIRVAVRTVQWERRLLIVIEAPTGPVDRRVADGAITRESVSVGIVRLMA